MNNRILFGFIAAFLGALVFAFGDLLIPQEGLYFEAAEKPDEFARFVTTGNYKIWAMRGLFGVFFEMFGVLSIYLALRNSRFENLAFWGFVPFMVHVAIGFGLFSVLYFMFPALGQLHLSGTAQATQFAAMEGGLQTTFLIVGSVVWILALILLSIAIWKDKTTLPKWSGIVMTLGFLLIGSPGQMMQFIANLIWGLAFLWMAIHFKKNSGKDGQTVRQGQAVESK